MNEQQQYPQTPSPPPPPQQPQQQPGSQGGGEDKVLGAICYIPIIGLIMYFVKKDDPFVFFHAKQGFVLSIVWIVLWILNGIFIASFFLLGGWVIISTIMSIIYIVIGIMVLIGFIKAIMGQQWKIPLIGDWAEKMGQKTPPPPPQQ